MLIVLTRKKEGDKVIINTDVVDVIIDRGNCREIYTIDITNVNIRVRESLEEIIALQRKGGLND